MEIEVVPLLKCKNKYDKLIKSQNLTSNKINFEINLCAGLPVPKQKSCPEGRKTIFNICSVLSRLFKV